MNRFNSLVYVQHFDAQKEKKKKFMQFTTIQNMCNIAKHLGKLTNETYLNINISQTHFLHKTRALVCKSFTENMKFKFKFALKHR